METGKTKQYFKYAIGEILLVMVGILLALQVNNWNQNRITKNTERDTLKNLLAEIQLDTLDIGFNLNMHKTALEHAELLFNFLNGDESVQAEAINFTEVLGNPVVAILNTSTYTSLVNNSPNLISNQTLKKKIFVHYNLVYTSILEVENGNAGFKPYDKLLPFFQKHFTVNKEFTSLSLSSNNSTDYFNEDYKRTSLYPKDLELLKTDEAFKVTLSEVIYLRSITLSVYREALKRIDELSSDITTELNTNFE